MRDLLSICSTAELFGPLPGSRAPHRTSASPIFTLTRNLLPIGVNLH